MKADERICSPPWGRWLVLSEENDFKVKQIEVFPGNRLSYQKHLKREEHWQVVRGKAKATIDGKDLLLAPGDCLTVDRESLHRVENVGPETLIFIEIQRGPYLGEDDLVRVEDDYGRA